MYFKTKRWLKLLALFIGAMLLMTGCASSQMSYSDNSASAESQATAKALSNFTSVEPHTSEFYVNDFAGILSEEQHKQLMENAVNFEQETGGVQIVTTTISNLQNHTINDYAYTMYNQYGIGKENMGVLILLATDDREIKIEPGLGMEAYFTDSISGDLIDDFALEDFRADRFADGLVNLQKAVIDYTAKNVPLPWNETTVLPSEETNMPSKAETSIEGPLTEQENNVNAWSVGLLLVGFVISLIFAVKNTVSLGNYKQLYKKTREKYDSAEKTFKAQLAEEKESHSKELKAMEEKYRNRIASVKAEFRSELRSKDTDIYSLQGKLSEATKKSDGLSSTIVALEEQFARVKTLHPEIEVEISQLIDREHQQQASDIDKMLAKVISLRPDKDNVHTFQEAYNMLYGLTSGVMQYIQTDLGTLEKLYKDSQELLRQFEKEQKEKADKEAADAVTASMDSVLREYSDGTYSNYEEIASVNQRYESLTSDQKRYIPHATRTPFINLYSAAKVDYSTYSQAKAAEKEVSSIIGIMYRAQANDRNRLKRAMSVYKSLSGPEAAYFDSALLSTLKKFIREADEDYEEEERARKRRAAAMQSSSRSSTTTFGSGFGTSRGSFGGHSGFSGHGGRSSGGGASRKF